MPPVGDIVEFLRCQAFGTTVVPKLDLTGKTFVVTGANTGLGLDCSKHLARMNASTIILGVRDRKKGETAKKAILKDTGCKNKTRIEVWEIDLDHHDSVLLFADRIRSELDRLDGFVANAGIELIEFETSEGLERTLTVNVVSTFLLAIAAIPKLQETAAAHGVDTRLSIVGSLIHFFAPDQQLDVPGQQDMYASLSDSKTADMSMRYFLSKLIVHQCFLELVKCMPRTVDGKQGQVIANVVNPGWCGTELGRAKNPPFSERMMFRLLGRTSEQGSRTLVHGVTAGRESHGKYLSECKVKRQSTYVQSQRGQELGKRLWKDLQHRVQEIDTHVAAVIA